ncbi:DUF169 domain-containing protein [Papillibacter cinnamivorans]|uniref:Uncharacterized conserved protein, DUF169 family n=1 Tax=Papillibacter cinnamivorans DSM 12816 TaxID=1122930 RepID=A0A1W2ABL2_9FIRM|nr:DUF169 domain-containing protein [Papillibacter cinnamivorans]SMC57872.1 Uncharacterized conserved protein, DUF169 family [Papillibacter cinnamivorans DSM 12816]
MNPQTEKLHEALTSYIRPLSFPIALKFLKNEAYPMKVRRPASMGGKLTLCQGCSIVRKYGWVMGFEMEDCACGPQLAHFGAIPYTEKQREGGIIYPIYTKTPEGARNCEALLPRLPEGMYDRMILAPLEKAEFRPDVIIIYVNPGQAARLIQGAVFCSGEPIATLSAGRCACVSEIVVPFVKKGYSCTIPGGGEKMFALTGDDEMAFSLHASRIDELAEGLASTHKSGIGRYPWPVAGVRAKAAMPDSYKFLEELAAARYPE